MKRSILLTILGALSVLSFAAPVLAICVEPQVFSTAGYIYTPGLCDEGYPCRSPKPFISSITKRFSGKFWALTAGNPAPSAGNDNGGWPAREGSPRATYPNSTGWVGVYPRYPAYINFVPATNTATTWSADSRIDGCIFRGGVRRCMALLFEDYHDETSYFAFLTDAPAPTADFVFPEKGQGPKSIVLHRAPTPEIVSVERLDGDRVSFEVNAPGEIPGLRLDPGCDGEVVRGYRLYAMVLDSGRSPVDPDRASWTALTDAPVAIDQPSTVELTCAADRSVHMARTLVFDSGYELTYVTRAGRPYDCAKGSVTPIGLRK